MFESWHSHEPRIAGTSFGKRIGLVVTNVLGQRRLFDEPLIGAAHFVIFWAFVLYASTFFWSLLRGLIPALIVPYPDEVAWVSTSVQVIGVLAVVALCVAAVRRYFFTPVSLERSWDAAIILVLIAVVLLSSLAGAGFRALGVVGGESSRSVGGFLGVAFASLGVSRRRRPGAVPVDLVDSHDDGARIPGLPAIFQALAFVGFALQRLLCFAANRARCPPRPKAPPAWKSSPGGNCSAGWHAPNVVAATAHAPALLAAIRCLRSSSSITSRSLC